MSTDWVVPTERSALVSAGPVPALNGGSEMRNVLTARMNTWRHEQLAAEKQPVNNTFCGQQSAQGRRTQTHTHTRAKAHQRHASQSGVECRPSTYTLSHSTEIRNALALAM